MPQKPLDLSSGLKTCPRCKTTKPLSDYYKSKGTMHGYQVYCKPCCHARVTASMNKNPKLREKMRVYAKGWREQNPEYQLDRNMMKYGLLQADYLKMLAAQGGVCAICKIDKAGGRGKFHVDHCHDKGTVRGLLCHNCNLGIGHFKHRTELLDKAKSYLLSEGCSKC
jgi:hypothetical protein